MDGSVKLKKLEKLGNRSVGCLSDWLDATVKIIFLFFLENEHEKKRTFKTKKKHNQNPRQRHQKLDVRFVSASFKFIRMNYQI